MHVALVSQWFPPESGWGGVGTYTHVMANALARMGHEVTVISTRTSGEVPAVRRCGALAVHRVLVAGTGRLGRLPVARRYARTAGLLRLSVGMAAKLREISRQLPIDIVEFPEVNAPAWAYSRQPIAPFVVRCHTPTFVLRRYYTRQEAPYDTRLISSCERTGIRRASRLTAPSRDMARTICESCGTPQESFTVIPNCLEAGSFKPTSPAARNGQVTVLHVGRLERVKGVSTLAEAIPAVVAQCPNARFVFVGGDRRSGAGQSQRAEMESRIRQDGMAEHVHFTGYVEHEDLEAWYGRADLCAVPSMLYESFSYTSAQAMLAARPVVASRIGGIPETVVDGTTGILVDPGNAKDLAQAIVRLAGDHDLRERMGRAGRERVLSEFAGDKVAERTLDVYSSAIQQFSSPRR